MSLAMFFKTGTALDAKGLLSSLKSNPGASQEVEPLTGNTPLHYACCGGAPIKVVDALLAAYPDAANMADSEGDSTIATTTATATLPPRPSPLPLPLAPLPPPPPSPPSPPSTQTPTHPPARPPAHPRHHPPTDPTRPPARPLCTYPPTHPPATTARQPSDHGCGGERMQLGVRTGAPRR